MKPFAIQVEELGKRYRLGLTHARSLRDVAEKLRGRWSRKTANHDHDSRDAGHFWALRDITFEVEPGEVLGIIGRNGAGKSTLLKVLSRITFPTEGRAVSRGRTASLLEVGTGFHPELTGRENIYLNGAILGMRRAEVHQKLRDIIDFSGVETFIDTPVKRYSSGMRVRLGFAVAAHLEPEILIVDEVLAVGDAGFQQRCLGKMHDVARSGRTVLFVSHNMAAVQNLCTRALLLEKGRISVDALPADVTRAYLEQFSEALDCGGDLRGDIERKGTGDARFESIALETCDGEPAAAVCMGDGLQLRLRIRAGTTIRGAVAAIGLSNQQGLLLCGIDMKDVTPLAIDLEPGEEATLVCRIPQLNVGTGRYFLGLKLRDHSASTTFDFIERAASFEVIPADVFGTGRTPSCQTPLFLVSEWGLDRTTVEPLSKRS